MHQFVRIYQVNAYLKLVHFSVCMCLVAQLCLNLCNPWTVAHWAPLSMGILQARILVAME